jgi:hypothetical protein
MAEHSIAVYGIISRMLMFALFLFWVLQGFLPIAGYNGAQNYQSKGSKHLLNMRRFRLVLFFVVILCYAIVTILLMIKRVEQTPNALRGFRSIAYLIIQLIGSAYFQAVGKTKSTFTNLK